MSKAYDEYNAARARHAAGYSHSGYLIRELLPDWNGNKWSITKDGFHVAICTSRAEAERVVGELVS